MITLHVRRLYHQVKPKSTVSEVISLKPERGGGEVTEDGEYGEGGGRQRALVPF